MWNDRPPRSKVERLQDFAKSQQDINFQAQFEKVQFFGKPWSAYDSKLESPDTLDGCFSNTFACVTPPGPTFKEYITTQLKPLPGNRIGIELGGPASNLFSNFPKGFFTRTAGVTLADRRFPFKKLRDWSRRHHVIPGNLLEPSTVDSVENWLDQDSPSLVIQRIGGGIKLLPRDPFIFGTQLGYWYRQLSTPGLMFMQVPSVLEPLIDPWMEKVQQEAGASLDVACAYNPDTWAWKVLRVNKFPGAPNSLPLLTAREALGIYRQKAK